MRKALDTAALGLAGLALGLAAASLPAAAASGADLGLSKEKVALALGLGLWTRALSAAFTGTLVDRFGARRALRDAAAGSAAAALGLAVLLRGGRAEELFVAVAILHAALCYFAAFAGPAAARANAARLAPAERGLHAGLYGATAFPAEAVALPAGLWLASRLPPSALHFLPAAAAVLALAASRGAPAATDGVAHRSALPALGAFVRRRDLLASAALEACSGAARWGLLVWAAPFLSEVHHIRPGAALFGGSLAAIVAGAALGPLLCGALSDKAFGGRRAPAALTAFAALAAALFGLGRALEPVAAVAFLGAACAAAFGAHALLSGAFAMDAGGPGSAGAASGLLDGVHHAAGGLAVMLVGALLDRGGWGSWTNALLPFALAGAALSPLLRPESRAGQ